MGPKLQEIERLDSRDFRDPETDHPVEGGLTLINSCPECLKKQREIDGLKEEIHRLRQKLAYQGRKAKEGFFGSSTPSAKLPLKANSDKDGGRKPKGARPGHAGAGRKRISSSEINRVMEAESTIGDHCPQCGSPLVDKGSKERLILESQPLQAEPILYRLPKRYCPRCHRLYQPAPPGVLPKHLFGNQLLTTSTVMHYLHGIPLGRVCEQLRVNPGSLVESFHRLARFFERVIPRLIEAYRQSYLKHADETGWRTDGQNGYVWLFTTDLISLFLFRKSRSGKIPQMVLGQKPLPGVLVVDRYAGYNKAPCSIQYCYAHLLREVEDLEKDFPDSEEVRTFVSVMAPLLASAMKLRTQPIQDPDFYPQAAQIKTQILAAVDAPSMHLGIRRIQEIFSENGPRLYHWAQDRRISADNNLAERDLRPTVIARKVSFGSVSDAGANTRGILMSILYSLKKHRFNVEYHLKAVLDQLAKDSSQDPYPLLFPKIPQPP
jgi:transposase